MAEFIWLIHQQYISFAAENFWIKMGWDNKNRECSVEAEEGFDPFLDGIKGTLFFQMHRINLIMFRLANKHLTAAAIPIKSEQIPVLICIYKGNKRSQQEVANMLHRDKSSIQRTVIVLQKKGLITVHPDKKDKRRNVLETTKKGKTIATKIASIIRDVEAEIIEVFDAEEALNNIQSLKNIADNLEQIDKPKAALSTS